MIIEYAIYTRVSMGFRHLYVFIGAASMARYLLIGSAVVFVCECEGALFFVSFLLSEDLSIYL